MDDLEILLGNSPKVISRWAFVHIFQDFELHFVISLVIVMLVGIQFISLAKVKQLRVKGFHKNMDLITFRQESCSHHNFQKLGVWVLEQLMK